MASNTANIGLTRRPTSARRRSGTSRTSAERASRVHVERMNRSASARADAPVRHVRHVKGVLIVLALIAAAVLMLYGPAREYYVAWRDGMALEDRYEAVRAENDQIQKEIDGLMTQEGIESTARSLGYVGEGEGSVVVRGLPEETATPAANANEEELPWFVGPLDTLFNYPE